jgi:TRAP-type C4-dicarboxylate transport system permease small subunit
MKTYLKATDMLYKVIEYIAIALLVAVISIFFLQTVLRFTVSVALAWAEELCRYLFIWMVFLGGGIGMRRGAHVGFDIVKNLLPEKFQIYLSAAIGAVVLFFAYQLVQGGLKLTAQTSTQVTPGLGVPMSCVYAALAAGGLLFIIFTVDAIIRKVVKQP